MSGETPDPGLPPTSLLDDRTIEALVRGEGVPRQHAGLADFAHEVRAAAQGPVPEAGPALRALFAGTTTNGAHPVPPAVGNSTRLRAETTDRSSGGRPPDTARGATVPRSVGVVARVAGMGVAAKVALATAVAAAAVGGAGAAGTLPRRADSLVRDAIEAVTPFEFDDPADAPAPGAGDDGTDGDSGQSPATATDPTATGSTPGAETGTTTTGAPGGSAETPAATVAPGPDDTPPSTVPTTGPPGDPGPPDTRPTPPSTVPDRPGTGGG